MEKLVQCTQIPTMHEKIVFQIFVEVQFEQAEYGAYVKWCSNEMNLKKLGWIAHLKAVDHFSEGYWIQTGGFSECPLFPVDDNGESVILDMYVL